MIVAQLSVYVDAKPSKSKHKHSIRHKSHHTHRKGSSSAKSNKYFVDNGVEEKRSPKPIHAVPLSKANNDGKVHEASEEAKTEAKVDAKPDDTLTSEDKGATEGKGGDPPAIPPPEPAAAEPAEPPLTSEDGAGKKKAAAKAKAKKAKYKSKIEEKPSARHKIHNKHDRKFPLELLEKFAKDNKLDSDSSLRHHSELTMCRDGSKKCTLATRVELKRPPPIPLKVEGKPEIEPIEAKPEPLAKEPNPINANPPPEDGKVEIGQGAHVPSDTVAPGGAFLTPLPIGTGDRPTVIVNDGGAPYLSLSGTVEGGQADDMRGGADWMEGQTDAGDTTYKPPPPRINGMGGPVPSTFTVKQQYGNGVFKTQHVSINGCTRSTNSKRCTETTNSMKSVPPVAIGTEGRDTAYNHENALIQSVIKASSLSDKQQYYGSTQTKQIIVHPKKRFENNTAETPGEELSGNQTSNEELYSESVDRPGDLQKESDFADQSFAASRELIHSRTFNSNQDSMQATSTDQGLYRNDKFEMGQNEVRHARQDQGYYGEINAGALNYNSHVETDERLFHPDGMSTYGDHEGNLEVNVQETGHVSEPFYEDAATRCSFGDCRIEDRNEGQMAFDSSHDTAGLTTVAHDRISASNGIQHLQSSNYSSKLVNGIPDDFQFGKTWFEGMNTKMITRRKNGMVNKPPFYGLESNKWMPKSTDNPYQFTINHGYVKENKVLQTQHDASPFTYYAIEHHNVKVKSTKEEGSRKPSKSRKTKNISERKKDLERKIQQFTNSSKTNSSISINTTSEKEPLMFVQEDAKINGTTSDAQKKVISIATFSKTANNSNSNSLKNRSSVAPDQDKSHSRYRTNNQTSNASISSDTSLPAPSHVMFQSSHPQVEPMREESGTKRDLKSSNHRRKLRAPKTREISGEDKKFIRTVMNLAYKSADEELTSEENAKARTEQKKRAGNAKKTHREIAASKKQLRAAHKKAKNETLQSVVKLGEAIIDTADLRSRINKNKSGGIGNPEDKFVQTVMTASKDFDDDLVSSQRLDVIPNAHFEHNQNINPVAKTRLEYVGENGIVDVQTQGNIPATSKVHFVKDSSETDEDNQEESGDGDIGKLIKSENEDTLPFFKDEPSVFNRFKNFTRFQKFPKASKTKNFQNFTAFNGGKSEKKIKKGNRIVTNITLPLLANPKKDISFNNFSDFNGFVGPKSKVNQSDDSDISLGDDLMGENAAETSKTKPIAVSTPVVNLKTVAKPIDWMSGLEQENDAFDSQLLQAEETGGAKATSDTPGIRNGVVDEYASGNQDFGLESGWSAATAVSKVKGVDLTDSKSKKELVSSRSALEKPNKAHKIKNGGTSHQLITKRSKISKRHRNRISKRHKKKDVSLDAKTLESAGVEYHDDEEKEDEENKKFEQSVAKASVVIDYNILKEYKGGPHLNNHNLPHVKVLSRPKAVALTGHKDFFETVYKASQDFDDNLISKYQYHRDSHHKRHHKVSNKAIETTQTAGKDYLDAIAKATKQFDNKMVNQSMERPPEMQNPCYTNGKPSTGVSDDCRYGDSWVEGQAEGIKTWYQNGTRIKDPFITSTPFKGNSSSPYSFTLNTHVGKGKVIKTQHTLTDCPTCVAHIANAQMIDGSAVHPVSNIKLREPTINIPAVPSGSSISHVVSQEGLIIDDAYHDNSQSVLTLQPVISQPVLAAQPVGTITCDCNRPLVHRPCVSVCGESLIDIPEQVRYISF